MNFIANESAQKLRGGFYTAPEIADFLSRWVLEKQPASLLEPSCGDGAFLRSVVRNTGDSLRKIVACEINPGEAEKARAAAPETRRLAVEVHTADFLKWFLFHSEAGAFDAVLGNPPFIRYQYLPEEQQFLAGKIFSRFGLPFTAHTNMWVPFVIAALALLRPGGRLGMVVPSELLHIRHAQSLRRFLASHCSGVLILDPEELWFDEALQGVVLLLAEKKAATTDASRGVAVMPVSGRAFLGASPSLYFETADYVNGSCLEGKWMPVFLSRRERSLLEAFQRDPRFPKFLDLADVDVGIVTGANKFFLVSDAVVEAFGLQKWAHPMFGRSEHVRGLIFDTADLEANRNAALPTNFLWFDDAPAQSYPEPVQRYLQSGAAQNLTARFKCRTRDPWFRVPSVYSTSVALLKRAHQYPRLLWNRAGAFTTDTAYRIRPKEQSPASLVYAFLNSLTCLCAELEGRHYGGGVLELVPSEIERLLIPQCAASEKDLGRLDGEFRAAADVLQILRQQDKDLLGRNGLSPSDQDTVHQAWDRLRNRRQRNPAMSEAASPAQSCESP